jgi:Domain of unknown function (DUF1844)
MAEEKENKIKVTDRRKFNSDGTPREQSEVPVAPQIEQAQADNQAAPSAEAASPAEDASPAEGASNAEDAQSNVVSFPGETAKKNERAGSQVSNGATAVSGHQAEENDEESAGNAQARAAASAAEQAYNQMKPRGAVGQPEASLLALLDMLAGEAAMCMGMVKSPVGAEIPIDLDTARQVIDMLGMLQQKTKGNLTAEEKDVLENILAYLRMQFVALSRSR